MRNVGFIRCATQRRIHPMRNATSDSSDAQRNVGFIRCATQRRIHPMRKQVPNVARNLLEQVFDIRRRIHPMRKRRIHPMRNATSDSPDAQRRIHPMRNVGFIRCENAGFIRCATSDSSDAQRRIHPMPSTSLIERKRLHGQQPRSAHHPARGSARL